MCPYQISTHTHTHTPLPSTWVLKAYISITRHECNHVKAPLDPITFHHEPEPHCPVRIKLSQPALSLKPAAAPLARAVA